MLLLFLFRSGLARHGLKQQILLKSQSTQNFRDIKACGSVKTRRRENAKFIVCKVYNYLYKNIRSSRPEVFFQRGVLKNFAKFTEKHLWQIFFKYSCRPQGCRSRVFVADFEHVFFYWEKYRITTAVLRIIGKPYPRNKSLLKINSQDCVSLLANCNMPKTFFNCIYERLLLKGRHWHSTNEIFKFDDRDIIGIFPFSFS